MVSPMAYVYALGRVNKRLKKESGKVLLRDAAGNGG